MLIWQWGLIVSSALLFLILIFVLRRYFLLKKIVSSSKPVINSKSDVDEQVFEEEKKQWLGLLIQQKKICAQLLDGASASDFQNKAALSCWAIFLDVEIHIIEHSVPPNDVIGLLDAFKGLLSKIDKAQEIDELLKSLKVNQSILSELNKIIQRAGDKVSTQVNITSELNAQLEKLQTELKKEPQLDEALASLRAEMASLCEFAERLKLHLDEVKSDDGDLQYIDALETFLSDAKESTFLHSMRAELDDKVADLKQLAAYQREIIADLKGQVRKAKEGVLDDGKSVGTYDISIVRLEKILLESSHVVKRLEAKLESLQTIKYNLNIDVMKRDEALKQKKAQLAEKSDGSVQRIDIYEVFDEERNTMQNMEDLLHQGNFTEEAHAFSSEQTSKLSSLRLMVNESELYVEMLEKDLDKARVLRESLEHKLLHPEMSHNDEGGSDVLLNQDLEEAKNLNEINEELSKERKRLISELNDNQVRTQEFNDLQKKVDELDGKIESVQTMYMEMEERYLMALMAKEDEQ
jgi:hypothetical protein